GMIVTLGTFNLNAQEEARGFRGPFLGGVGTQMRCQEESGAAFLRLIHAGRSLRRQQGPDDLIPPRVLLELLPQPVLEGTGQDEPLPIGDPAGDDVAPVAGPVARELVA